MHHDFKPSFAVLLRKSNQLIVTSGLTRELLISFIGIIHEDLFCIHN